MKKRKWFMAFVAMFFIVISVVGNHRVEANDKKIVFDGAENRYEIKPGETTSLKIPFKVKGGYMTSVGFKVVPGENAPFTIKNVKLIYSNVNVEVTGMGETDPVYAEFDVVTKETASIGSYKATFDISYMAGYSDGIEERQSVKADINLDVLEEKAPTQLTISSLSYEKALPGSDTNLNFTVKNEGDITAYNVYLSMNYENSKTDIAKNYTANSIKVGDLSKGATKVITLPISILSTATAGKKPLTVNFSYKQFGSEVINSTYDISVNVKQNESKPKTPYLQFDKLSYEGSLKPGKSFVLKAKLRNDGDSQANNIKLSIDEGSLGKDTIIKEYLTERVSASNMKKGGTQTVELPLAVSKQTLSGLLPVKVNVTYTDESGVSYALSHTLYLDVVGEAAASTDLPSFLISNVGQNISRPQAGERFELSFDIENNSLVDASGVKIATTNLSSANFIPINSEPYIYIEKLLAGEKKTITIPLIVSDQIAEGLNYVTVEYSYAGGASVSTFNIPVKEVVNEIGSISKPKVIISKFVTDIEQLRAGSTFNFTFDLYNTNASADAKNIKITITQAENIFAVTQGSNSFFIDRIGPGETVQKTLEMKVKSDAVTKAYPLVIAIDYEYDVAEPNPTTGELVGEIKETEELNLQAVENARPVAENISVYSYDGQVIFGNTAMLGFEFYNMGKSPLNNVIVYVEGDFAKSDGSMYFIGTVGPGVPTYVEFEVIPNIEGLANGILRITFEDSNGDLVESIKEFSTDVFPPQIFNPDPGLDPGLGGEVFNPGIVAKKAILPTWLFIVIQVAIFVVFIPVTRKIIISVYKAKLRKKEESQYE